MPRTCWNCGASKPTGSLFCGRCGKPDRSCLSCGAQIPADDTLCPDCHRRHKNCSHCAALMSLDASFCQSCGRETLEKRRREDQRIRASLHEKRRATTAMAIVFLGVLLGILLGLILSAPVAVVAYNLVFVLSGWLALVLLGRPSYHASVPVRTTVGSLALGVLAVVPSFAISYLYVSALPGDPGIAEDGLTLGSLLTVCILPALVEEWLCRGVLWVAARRIAGAGNTILITAILFAMMHGLVGQWFLVYFPHRFAVGLIFGWLRLRSGSLLPGMLAHFLHNLLVLLV